MGARRYLEDLDLEGGHVSCQGSHTEEVSSRAGANLLWVRPGTSRSPPGGTDCPGKQVQACSMAQRSCAPALHSAMPSAASPIGLAERAPTLPVILKLSASKTDEYAGELQPPGADRGIGSRAGDAQSPLVIAIFATAMLCLEGGSQTVGTTSSWLVRSVSRCVCVCVWCVCVCVCVAHMNE